MTRRLFLGILVALGILFPVSITPGRGGGDAETKLAAPSRAARVEPESEPVWADSAPAATGLPEQAYARGK